ncbi:ADP-ribose glycohydrolase MACROD2 isoform X13 [Arvicanthis niloticus]|uniref:ADP-ribose glycohydrolase MACROD2 isoform X13 n=1 Tax=Arvicanthis niloticus TaxID=61156 RepID=UPI00402B5748
MYPSNKKKKVWREEKERLLKMTLEERRKEYIRDYVSLSTILSWKEEMKSKGQNDEENTQEAPQMKKSLSEKVSLYRGDITLLEVDAIVNAGFNLGMAQGSSSLHSGQEAERQMCVLWKFPVPLQMSLGSRLWNGAHCRVKLSPSADPVWTFPHRQPEGIISYCRSFSMQLS